MKPQKKHDDEEQSRMFIETARQIEADEEQSAADTLMGRLVHTPPDPKKTKPKGKPEAKKPAK